MKWVNLFRFSSTANEPAALKQRITVRSAQNVNHIEIVDAEWKRVAALWTDRGNLEFGRPDILGTRSLDMRPRRAGRIRPTPFSCSEDYNSPKRGTHPFAERRHPMAQKTFLLIASIIFSLIALGHLSRLVFKWSALLGTWQVPLWVNGVALVIFAYLASEGFRLARKP